MKILSAELMVLPGCGWVSWVLLLMYMFIYPLPSVEMEFNEYEFVESVEA